MKKLLPAHFFLVLVMSAFHRVTVFRLANNPLKFFHNEPRQTLLQLFFRMFKPSSSKLLDSGKEMAYLNHFGGGMAEELGTHRHQPD
ncbi:MAG: hypothetical protein ACRC9O_07445 [Plesiomonas sp.]|uniref:hypothetical protein n=1 Tax=Plesiomonas sp. TaxID=2486279 RepID=UPI003F399297